MTLRCTLLAFSLLPTLAFAVAQQTATKPVLSAKPAPTEATPAPAPLTTTTNSLSPDYVIAPDDSIQVSVWKEPTLSSTLPVRPDGRISLPLIGDLTAAGFTPMKLGDDIATRLQKYVTDPRVTVTVTGVHVDKVFMLGEIGHVGPVALLPGMTPLQAISAAGGLSPYAHSKRIYILRTVNGQQKKIPYNYKKALKDGDEQGVTFIPNDTLVVP